MADRAAARFFLFAAACSLAAPTVFPTAVGAQEEDASEFSVRLEAETGSLEGGEASIRIHAPCSSFACGVRMLDGNVENAPLWSSAFAGTGRFRVPLERLRQGGSSPGGAGDEAWWIVVDGGGLPVARLWRRGIGGDDLPPAPRLAGRSCTISVRSREDGAPIGGALVVATAPALEDGDRFVSGVEPWRPWMPPVVTSPQGAARIQAPADADITVRVRAAGYRAARAVCEAPGPGGSPMPAANVVLERDGAPSDIAFVSDGGAPLAGALVRDRDGWAVGLTDEQGRVRLPNDPRGWWLEERSGRIHDAEPPDGAAEAKPSGPGPGSRLIAVASRTEVTSTAGNAATGSRPELPAYSYWVHAAHRPAFGFHNERSFIQRAAATGAFEFNMLPGDRAWFAAPGFAYDSCSSEEIGSPACPYPRPAVRIRGHVLDETGAPVRDAEIELSTKSPRPRAPTLRQFLRTGSDGAFTSDRFPPSTGLFDLVAVSIRHPDFLPVLSPAIDGYCNDDRECIIEMKRGAVVSGAVFDRSSGRALADVEVGVGPISADGTVGVLGDLSGLRRSGIRATRTNRTGRFALRTPPGRFDLALRTETYAFRIVRGIQVEEDGLELGAIFLEPASVFVGRVVDDESRPIAGARVNAAVTRTPDAFGQATVGDFGDGLILETGADGSFRIPGLASTMRVDLGVAADGYASRRLEGVALPPPTEPFTIKLRPGSVLAGRVTRNGEPTAGTFELSGSSQRHAPDVLTGDRSFVAAGVIPADGSFRIPGLRAGRYRLLVQTPRGDERLVVQIAENEEKRVDVEIGNGSGEIVGRVRERGVGMPGVEVRFGRIERVVTDANGRFSFPNVPMGSFVLEAAPAGVPSERKHVRVNRGPRRVDFDFGRYRVSGRVVAEAGLGALTGAALTFSPPPTLSTGRLSVPTTTVTLADDGRFEAELRRGRHEVDLDLAGARLRAAESFVVRGDRAGAVIRVRGAPRGRIVGRLLGLEQSELDSLRIEAVGEDFTRHEADFDATGRFVVARLDPGTWTIVAEVGASNRRTTHRVDVRGGDVHADLTFERGHDLTGVVLLDGIPLDGAQVLAMRGEVLQSARRQFTRHDGAFAFRDLEAGRYTVAVGASSESVRVPGAERTEIRLLGGRIRGVVVDPDTARPVVAASVGLWPAAANRDQAETLGLTWTSWTDASGRFDFGRVPAGEWMLQVEEGGRSPRGIRLLPGGQVELLIHE